MRCVTGLGGVFFKAKNPEKLYEWYEKHLGIKQDVPGQGVSFLWERGWRSGGVRLLVDFPAGHNVFSAEHQAVHAEFSRRRPGRSAGEVAGRRRVDRSQSGRLRLQAICLDRGPGRKPD